MSFTHDMYISYEDELIKELSIFHQKLEAPPYNYKIWRDEINLVKNDQQSIEDQTCDAIKSSKIFLCFLTRRYAESDGHKGEINYARTLKKTIIILKIENIKLNQVGMSLANSVSIDCFKHPSEWHDPGLWKDEPNSAFEIAKQIKISIQVNQSV